MPVNDAKVAVGIAPAKLAPQHKEENANEALVQTARGGIPRGEYYAVGDADRGVRDGSVAHSPRWKNHICRVYNLASTSCSFIDVTVDGVILVGSNPDLQINVKSPAASLTLDGVTGAYLWYQDTATHSLTIKGSNNLSASLSAQGLTVQESGTGSLTIGAQESDRSNVAVIAASLALESGTLSATGKTTGVYATAGAPSMEAL